ncbi:hypothetical protein NKG95_20505 [Mesorhizobium sp. M1423]|uniref:hypothetical protein n=1 Tax=Mesorhizobium sp. M1423 TaxID=2957101 RepID=UPI00333D9B03
MIPIISRQKRLMGALAATVMGSLAMSAAKSAEWSPTYLGCVFTLSAFSAPDDIYPDHRNEKKLKVAPTKFEMAFAAIDFSASGRS